MADQKKVPYSHRILAAIDSSIAAGNDFIVGQGWRPLVNIGRWHPLTKLT